VRHLHAAAHVAPGSTIVEGAAISLPPEIHHGTAPPCVSRPNYPARFGLDPLHTCFQGFPPLPSRLHMLASGTFAVFLAKLTAKRKTAKRTAQVGTIGR